MDLHKVFRAYRAHSGMGWWFRGHARTEWKLIPKAGRPDFFLPNNRDLGRFNYWRKQAIAYMPTLPSNDWECLAVAQHFGLVTRLLDWTENPLVATYFAVVEQFDADGAVWMFQPEMYVQEDALGLNVEGVGYAFIPRAISARIINQKAMFTVHSPPDKEIEVRQNISLKDDVNLARIVIPKELKQEVLEHLNDYGLNSVTLFPDLDGLSRHVNWQTAKMVTRASKRTE